MRPLSLAERSLGETSVALGELLNGQKPPLEGETDVRLADYAAEVVMSGFLQSECYRTECGGHS